MQIKNSVVCDASKGCIYKQIKLPLVGEHAFPLTGFVCKEAHVTALYTGKHFYLPKSTEKKHARRGLYALWITILCVLDNKDVYMWQEKVYDPKT